MTIKRDKEEVGTRKRKMRKCAIGYWIIQHPRTDLIIQGIVSVQGDLKYTTYHFSMISDLRYFSGE